MQRHYRTVSLPQRLWRRLNDPKDSAAGLLVAAVLLSLEAALNGFIIMRVKCACGLDCSSSREAWTPTGARCLLGADTEIDWVAYMQEVEGYRQVRGLL